MHGEFVPKADDSGTLKGRPIGTSWMYILAPGIKGNAVRQWSLPDRVFFASGACHILAYAFLNAYPNCSFAPIWIKPARGFTGESHRSGAR